MVSEFLSMEILEWINLNIQDTVYFPEGVENWEVLFGCVCWNLWVRGNKRMFDQEYMEIEGVLEHFLFMWSAR